MCATTDRYARPPTLSLTFLLAMSRHSSIAVGDAERHIIVNGFNFFGQDAWQVTRKLNINLGLRYEYFGPPHNSSKDLAVFIPGRALQIQGNGIDSIFPPDSNNFAPRLGFAYQPKRWRFGLSWRYRRLFDQINMNPFFDYRPSITAADGLQDNPSVQPPYLSTA